MDKKVFLLDKCYYTREFVDNLTEDVLETMAVNDYANDAFIKIDANDYDSPEKAIVSELDPTEGLLEFDDYYIFAFGF